MVLAQSRHHNALIRCPVLGVKRTSGLLPAASVQIGQSFSFVMAAIAACFMVLLQRKSRPGEGGPRFVILIWRPQLIGDRKRRCLSPDQVVAIARTVSVMAARIMASAMTRRISSETENSLVVAGDICADEPVNITR